MPLLLAGQMFVAAPVYAATHVIKGTLSFEGHGLGEPPGYKVQPRLREFEVAVDECTWTIKMVLLGNTNYNYFLSTFDGTNVIYASKLNQEAFARLEEALRSRPKGTQTNLYQSCIVESGPVPRNLSSIANPYPWIAFCSGCYFQSRKNGLATDLYPANEHNSDYAARNEVPCTSTLSSSPPHLPVQVEYWWTNLISLSSDGKVVSSPLPAVFKDRFLAARFQAEQFTNVNGMSFPMKFEMREYRPLPTAASADDFRCTRIIRGTVTEIAASGIELRSEALAGPLLAYDLRSGTGAPIASYVIADGAVPPMNSSTAIAARAQAVRHIEARKGQAARKPGANGKSAVLLAMLGVSVAPIIFFAVARYRRKPTAN